MGNPLHFSLEVPKRRISFSVIFTSIKVKPTDAVSR